MTKFKVLPHKLCIFDFDDTLATTDAKIKITNKKLVFSTKEFADYHPTVEDVLDLSDFENGKLINPQPTNFLITEFKSIIDGNTDVMILTARPDTGGIKEFLSAWVDPSHLIIVGGRRGATGKELADLKKNAILERIDKYENILFFDDSITNIKAVDSINNPKIKTRLVKKP